MGAPGSFPVQEENLPLQAYLTWSDSVLSRAKHFVRYTLLASGAAPFVGIHLRNGVDWVRCLLTPSSLAWHLTFEHV